MLFLKEIEFSRIFNDSVRLELSVNECQFMGWKGFSGFFQPCAFKNTMLMSAHVSYCYLSLHSGPKSMGRRTLVIFSLGSKYLYKTLLKRLSNHTSYKNHGYFLIFKKCSQILKILKKLENWQTKPWIFSIFFFFSKCHDSHIFKNVRPLIGKLRNYIFQKILTFWQCIDF